MQYDGFWSQFRREYKALHGRRPSLDDFCESFRLDYEETLEDALRHAGMSVYSRTITLAQLEVLESIHPPLHEIMMGMTASSAEVAHYQLSHRVIEMNQADYDALAAVEHDVTLNEIKYPIPVLEVCSPEGGFLIWDRRYVKSFDLTAMATHWEPIIPAWVDDATLSISVPYRDSEAIFVGNIPLEVSAPFESPGYASCPVDIRKAMAVARNLMLYFHLDGATLPGGKAHGRPALGSIPPSMLRLPPDRVAHFRAGHYRTLRDARYYRGQPYPPAEWRIVRVKPAVVHGRVAVCEHERTNLL